MDPVALMSQSVVQYGCCAHGPLITMRIPRYLHSLFPVPLLLLLPYHPDRLTLGNSPSKEKKKRSLPCGPVTHQSQNGLVTFPSWHKSQNGSEMVLLLFRAGTIPEWSCYFSEMAQIPEWSCYFSEMAQIPKWPGNPDFLVQVRTGWQGQ